LGVKVREHYGFVVPRAAKISFSAHFFKVSFSGLGRWELQVPLNILNTVGRFFSLDNDLVSGTNLFLSWCVYA